MGIRWYALSSWLKAGMSSWVNHLTADIRPTELLKLVVAAVFCGHTHAGMHHAPVSHGNKA